MANVKQNFCHKAIKSMKPLKGEKLEVRKAVKIRMG